MSVTDEPASPSIQFFGHSTILITTATGKRIFVDPWLEGNPSCPAELQRVNSCDAIALTHGHADHASSVVRLAKHCGCEVFAIYELANLLAADGVPESNLQPMSKGGTVALSDGSGVTISMTHALHSSSYDRPDGTTAYAGEAAGIAVTLESGQSIYHAGDTCLFEEMRSIAARFRPDVALVPIGDRFTMGPEEAALIVREYLQPKVVIPIHFATFDLLTGTPAAFQEALAECSSELVVLEPGASYALT